MKNQYYISLLMVIMGALFSQANATLREMVIEFDIVDKVEKRVANGKIHFSYDEIYEQIEGREELQKAIEYAKSQEADPFPYFNQSAQQGNKFAQYIIASKHVENGDLENNSERILQLYQASADQDFAPAIDELGLWCLRGGLVEQDAQKAIMFFSRAADLGYCISQFRLGCLYESGLRGIAQDLSQAIYYHRLAADQGFAPAQTALAMLLFEPGVHRNVEEAVRLLQDAAAQGYDQAQFNLGTLHLTGSGVAKDVQEAVRLFLLAADQDNPLAQYNLGFMYEHGVGVAQDSDMAFEFLQNAARFGDPCPLNALAMMYAYGHGAERDPEMAFTLCKRAADDNYPPAQNNLALMYNNGTGTKKNSKEAVRLYKTAGKNGLSVAYYNLGMMYEEGNGVPRDTKEAQFYYKLAADKGDELAQERLQAIQEKKKK